MTGRIEHVIVPEDQLILEFLSGEIGWKEYTSFKKKLIQEPNYSPRYNVIADLTKQDKAFSAKMMEEMGEYISFIQEQGMQMEHKTAVIAYSPDHFIIGEMFNRNYKESAFKMKIFSTLEAAAFWLSIVPERLIYLQGLCAEMGIEPR